MKRLSRRKLLTTGLVAAAGLGAAHGVARATGKGLRVSHHRLRWPVPRARRIAQITDVHIGWATPERVLREVVEITRKARPDLVVLTGDYVNHSLKHADRVASFVAALPGPVVATLGNHDHWSGEGGVVDALRRGGAEVLQNRSVRLGGELDVVGVDDGHTHHDDVDRALAGVDPAGALILSHFPNTADHIAAAGGRLILSGHTHGGQLVVPGLTKLLVRAGGIDYLAGWYQLGQGRLYVNAGCGQSVEGLRAGESARTELAIFDLIPV